MIFSIIFHFPFSIILDYQMCRMEATGVEGAFGDANLSYVISAKPVLVFVSFYISDFSGGDGF